MAQQRRKRISEEMWTSRKDLIRDLFVTQKRTLIGKDGLISVMEREYDFFASKAQYESRLKKWGFRKYANKQQWHTILHTIDARKAQGKESDIYFQEDLLSKKKVQKEAKRYATRNLPDHDLGT